MKSDVAVKREYRSPRRDALRRQTRRAILDAAGRLFAERGYVGTSFEAVANAAGVGRATVFAHFASKSILLKAAYDVVLVGDDEPVALPDRPESIRVRAEPDARRFLAGYAGIAADALGRLGPIHEAIRGAAGVDPDAAAVLQAVRAERRRGGGNIVAAVRERGALRAGADPGHLADAVYALIDPAVYTTLVVERGWSHEAYVTWLGETLAQQLIGPYEARPPG
jgi:AcrR family transcriptional regulator